MTPVNEHLASLVSTNLFSSSHGTPYRLHQDPLRLGTLCGAVTDPLVRNLSRGGQTARNLVETLLHGKVSDLRDLPIVAQRNQPALLAVIMLGGNDARRGGFRSLAELVDTVTCDLFCLYHFLQAESYHSMFNKP